MPFSVPALLATLPEFPDRAAALADADGILAAANLGLRAASLAHDGAFLFDVYAATREEDMLLLSFSEDQATFFLANQFAAQHRHYLCHFPNCAYWLVTCGGMPVGRLYLWRGADEHRLVDLSLLPTWRRRGFGGLLLTALAAEADQLGAHLSLHVASGNPAIHLYRRHGFVTTTEAEPYHRMKKLPVAQPVDENHKQNMVEN